MIKAEYWHEMISYIGRKGAWEIEDLKLKSVEKFGKYEIMTKIIDTKYFWLDSVIGKAYRETKYLIRLHIKDKIVVLDDIYSLDDAKRVIKLLELSSFVLEEKYKKVGK